MKARYVAALLASGAAVVALLALLHGWRDLDYSNYSEGVYALTSRLLLDGEDLYGEVVVAQPPVMFFVGGGLLIVEDSITWLRLGVGAVQALTAGLVGLAVWRLTRNALAAALAAPLAMVTPWAVNEHGVLTPELVAGPMLVGGALLAASPRRAPAAAVLLSLAVFTKLPFAIPVVLVALAASDRRRCLIWLAGACGMQAVFWTTVFGPSMWGDIVLSQQETGLRTVKVLAEVVSQAGWNLLGLLIAAGAAVLLREHARDRDLLRTSAALAIGLLLTLPTMIKNGTGINVAVPIEAALVVLAVPGLVWSFSAAPRPRRLVQGVIALGLVLVLAQTVSLFAEPDDPRPFTRPDAFDSPGTGQQSEEVRAEVARARRCPAGVAYSGVPYMAFIAERRMPAGQPDGFLTTMSSRLEKVLADVNADQPRCP